MTDPVRLIDLDWPTFGTPAPPPPPSAAALGARIDALRARMAARDLTHVVLFADREHFANLAWLTNFDPRFEEAVLVVGTSGPPLLLVGNECAGYVGISALDAAGALRHELFQPLSLVSQPRGESRLLREILGDEGISDGARVGAVGWKYLRDAEHPDARHALDVPSWIADTLRDLAGHDRVVNATDLFIDPADGLRTVASVDDIAAFEHANAVAADGMRAMLFGLEEGMTDFEAMALAGLNGMPLGCHPTFATGPSRHLGLKSPSGEVLRRGAPMSANLCTWRANICRAGWLVDGPADLPDEARDYVEAFAGPYFAALAEWFGLMRIGTPGGQIQALIDERLPFDKFGIGLNPGHLIDLDEWTSSPIYPGSDLPIRSGMVIQVDVIPSSPRYFSTRMEDGIAILDASAREALRARHPDVHARCTARRAVHAGHARHRPPRRGPAALQHARHRAAVLPRSPPCVRTCLARVDACHGSIYRGGRRVAHWSLKPAMATDGTTTTDYLDDRFWREFGWRGFVLTLVSLACLNIALADLRGRHPVASLYTGADWSDPAAWTDRATWLQRRTSPGRATLPWQHDSATLVLADPARDRWHAGGLGGL